MESKNWQINNNRLEKEWKFPDFKTAVEFINRVAAKAKQLNHHPDISLHDYKFLKISLFSHDQNKITDKDYRLARMIDDIKIEEWRLKNEEKKKKEDLKT